MFEHQSVWAISCDTCRDDDRWHASFRGDRDEAVETFREDAWEVGDDLHRCWRCVREGRTERVL